MSKKCGKRRWSSPEIGTPTLWTNNRTNEQKDVNDITERVDEIEAMKQ